MKRTIHLPFGSNILMLALILMMSMLVRPCAADPLDKAIRHWESIGITGKIQDVDVNGKYLIVNERKIMVINQRRYLKGHKTKISDLQGKDLTATVLVKEAYVAIKGSQSLDEDTDSTIIVAREIYLLPKAMTTEELKQVPLLQGMPKGW